MLWYLESLGTVVVLVWLGVLMGTLVIATLPTRMQPGSRVFLSAPLGWAMLTLVATLLGWVGHGFAGWHCLVITGALSAAGAWTGRRWLRQSGRDAVRLTAFCVIASFPVLGSLLLHGTFNPYNDTIVYICHGQWLQAHGALEPAHTDGGHPAWGPAVYFRAAHLRIGTSCLLGWVQAMFGREWSYEVFPAVSALGIICGALGVGAALLAACPGRWPEAWLTALATAVTANGFVFGATNGFFAQTWGLAFAAAACGLRGMELGTHAPQKSGTAPWRTGLPLGLCVAASMQCYWDVLPLEGLALGSTYLLPWPGRDPNAWRRAWARAWVPGLTCVALVNAEWLHAIPGLLGNVHAVVANPVSWQLWDFPAHALGLRASIWEGGRWIVLDTGRWVLLAGMAGVAAWLAVMTVSLGPKRLRRWRYAPTDRIGWRVAPLIPALVWWILTAALIVHFRYFVPSPWCVHNHTDWPDGVGQSWSQYKLTVWASFAAICLVAALGTAATMGRRGCRWRPWLLGVLFLWCSLGSGWNDVNAWRLGKWLMIDAGVRRDPFAVCLAMRQKVAALPPTEWIYLDWPPDGHAKFREIMAYFLYDHRLASNWESGSYMGSYVTPEDARRTAADCDWVLKYRPPGGMILERSQRDPP